MILALIALIGLLVLTGATPVRSEELNADVPLTKAVSEAQEANLWDGALPLIAGLVGALIGSGTTLATITIQLNKEERRHESELAIQLALAERSHQIEFAKAHGGRIAPLAVYVSNFLELQSALKIGPLTPDRARELQAKNAALAQSFDPPPFASQ